MKILALEFSSNHRSVAIADDKDVLARVETDDVKKAPLALIDEALKKAKCRTRLCHLHVDDLKDFFYEEEQDYDDTDLINSWEELKARSSEKADSEED